MASNSALERAVRHGGRLSAARSRGRPLKSVFRRHRVGIRPKPGPSQDPSRHMTRGMVAFSVAAIGFGLALVAQWLSLQWLGTIAFVITAAGVLAGFIAMALGLLAAPREFGRELEEFRESQQKTWKRPDWKP